MAEGVGVGFVEEEAGGDDVFVEGGLESGGGSLGVVFLGIGGTTHRLQAAVCNAVAFKPLKHFNAAAPDVSLHPTVLAKHPNFA